MTSSGILGGALKGSLYGLFGGLILGISGSVFGPPIDYEKVLIWSNKFGKKTRFTNLETVSILKEDLYEVFQNKESNIQAFNEVFRNIQSAITLYHPIKVHAETAEVMTASRMTNFVIRASKAMEAMHVEILVIDVVKALHFQKAMMNLQLSLEEMINFVRLRSKNALPTLL